MNNIFEMFDNPEPTEKSKPSKKTNNNGSENLLPKVNRNKALNSMLEEIQQRKKQLNNANMLQRITEKPIPKPPSLPNLNYSQLPPIQKRHNDFNQMEHINQNNPHLNSSRSSTNLEKISDTISYGKNQEYQNNFFGLKPVVKDPEQSINFHLESSHNDDETNSIPMDVMEFIKNNPEQIQELMNQSHLNTYNEEIPEPNNLLSNGYPLPAPPILPPSTSKVQESNFTSRKFVLKQSFNTPRPNTMQDSFDSERNLSLSFIKRSFEEKENKKRKLKEYFNDFPSSTIMQQHSEARNNQYNAPPSYQQHDQYANAPLNAQMNNKFGGYNASVKDFTPARMPVKNPQMMHEIKQNNPLYRNFNNQGYAIQKEQFNRPVISKQGLNNLQKQNKERNFNHFNSISQRKNYKNYTNAELSSFKLTSSSDPEIQANIIQNMEQPFNVSENQSRLFNSIKNNQQSFMQQAKDTKEQVELEPEIQKSEVLEILDNLQIGEPIKFKTLKILASATETGMAENKLLKSIKKEQYMGTVTFGMIMYNILELFGSGMIKKENIAGRVHYTATPEFTEIFAEKYENKNE